MDRENFSGTAWTTVSLLRYGITTALNDETRVWLFSEGFTGLLNSIFKFMGLLLKCPDYFVAQQARKDNKISIKTLTRDEITHLVIDSTGLKVFGEGEWKIRQHGVDKRRVWRKLHLEWIVRQMKLSVPIYRTAVPLTHRLCRI